MRSILKTLVKLFTSNTFWVEDVYVLKETEKAYFLEFCNQKEWYPKSKIYRYDETKKRIKVDLFWLKKFS